MKKHLTLFLVAVIALAAFAQLACAEDGKALSRKAAVRPGPAAQSSVPPVFSSATTSVAVPATESAASGRPGFKLSWRPPAGVPADRIKGYNVYRSTEILGHYEKLTRKPVDGLSYQDAHLHKGKSYYYKVTAVLKDGTEGRATDPVGMAAGAGSGSPEQRLPHIETFTSTGLSKVTYLGETAVFVLSGDPGLKATFDIDGVEAGLPMDELKPGTYRGVYKVKQGQRVKDTFASATLAAADGGMAVSKTPATISLLGERKPSLTGLYAGVVESERVGLNWPRQTGHGEYYCIYRDTGRIVGVEGKSPLTGNMGKGVTAYIDTDVTPGATYYYVLAALGRQGQVEAVSDNLEVRVPPPGRVSGIDTVEEDSAGKVLKPGGVLKVTMRTAPGGRATFSLGTAVQDLEMVEKEHGLYTGTYSVREGDGVFTSKVTVSVRDSSGKSHFSNSATFVAVNAPRAASPAHSTGKGPAIHELRDDVQSVVGRSGRLTAGKTFTVSITGDPGCKAYFSLGDGIWKVPMKEDPGSPGTYKGEYTVKPGDNAGTSPDPLKTAFITGYLENASGGVSEPARSPAPVVVDTACDIKVDVSQASLPADAKSQSRVTITATDADGQAVANRRLTVLLEPPARYSGMVGGGGVDLAQTTDTQAGALGRLKLDFDDMTDSMGRITATYTAGFAAKTAMVVARDFSTGSVGMGYVTTGISSSVSVKLDSPAQSLRVAAARAPVYQLVLAITPAPGNPLMKYAGGAGDPRTAALTADGVSRANVVATLTKDGAPAGGKTITFGVSGAGGTLTASSATTDGLGRAQVFYIAGVRAGSAIITATETSTGISASNTIMLLADAPSRISVKAYPDVLTADGASTSRIAVELSDVNNNPTENVAVRFQLRGGAGMGGISDQGAVTDARGACSLTYTAGTTPGVATIDVTATSAAPTSEELKAAYARVVAPMVYDNDDFTELVVLKWFKAVGEPVGKGEPLAVVGSPLGHIAVYSPASGILDRIVVEPGVNVMEGKDIGVIR